jgi:hypothetical protein
MFFYVEKTPVVLSTSVASLTFSNIAVNSSSSLTFTVNSTGEATETITLSDDSNQFDFSPSTFSLTGGSSQVVTANFRPTSSNYKTGTVTISASGGSTKAVVVSGSATLQTRIAVGTPSALSSSGLSKPAQSPSDGSEGWYYKNTTTGQSGKADWAEWYFSSSAGIVTETMTASGSNINAYMVVNLPNSTAVSSLLAGQGPFLNVYTRNVAQGGAATPADSTTGLYGFKSRLSYKATGSAANYVTGSDYLLYTNADPQGFPNIPASRRYKMALLALAPASTSTGSFAAGQLLASVYISTNSAAPVNTIEFTLRGGGVETSSRMEGILCLKTGSV